MPGAPVARVKAIWDRKPFVDDDFQNARGTRWQTRGRERSQYIAQHRQ